MTDQEKRGVAVQAIDLFTNNLLSQVKNVDLAEAIYACIEQSDAARLDALKALVES